MRIQRRAKDYKDFLSTFEICFPLKIGAVVGILKDVKSKSDAADVIIKASNQKSVSSAVRSSLIRRLNTVITKYKSFKNNSFYWEDMVNFTNKTFKLPPAFNTDAPTSTSVSISPVSTSFSISTEPPASTQYSNEPSTSTQSSTEPSTRQQCKQCKVLQTSVKRYVTQNKHLRKVCRQGNLFEKSALNRTIKRKQEMIDNLRQKNKLLTKQLTKQLAKQMNQNTDMPLQQP